MTNQIVAFEGLLDARQNPLNAEVRAGKVLSLAGDAAQRVIYSRLQGYPAAQLLSREVYEFYSNDLSYIESSDFTSTLYAIHLQHDPVALESAVIQLQLGTDRTVEALTHELLHLRLIMLGFPFGELIEIPMHLDHHARDLIRMSNWVANMVQHEMIFEEFMVLGFDGKLFLDDHQTPVNYQKLFVSRCQNTHAGEVDFSRWCIEYIKHVCSARHGGSKDHSRYAQDALSWGSRLHPELKQTAAEIDRWVETGAFKDPAHYPRQVNLLLEFMRIPEFTGWVTLKRSEQRKTIAVRLDTQENLEHATHSAW